MLPKVELFSIGLYNAEQANNVTSIPAGCLFLQWRGCESWRHLTSLHLSVPLPYSLLILTIWTCLQIVANLSFFLQLTASGRKRAVAECWHYLWCAVKKKTSSELVSNCLSSGLPFFCLLSWKGIIGADLLGFMFLLFCSCLSQFREAMCWGQFDVVCKCSD